MKRQLQIDIPLDDIKIELDEIKSSIKQLKFLLTKSNLWPPIEKRKDDDEYFTLSEACNFLRISKPTIYEYAKQGRFKVYKSGGRTLFKKSEIKDSIARLF